MAQAVHLKVTDNNIRGTVNNRVHRADMVVTKAVEEAEAINNRVHPKVMVNSSKVHLAVVNLAAIHMLRKYMIH